MNDLGLSISPNAADGASVSARIEGVDVDEIGHVAEQPDKKGLMA